MKKQPRGSSCSFVSNNAIFICCWRDNNIVCLASNTIGTDPISVANRWSTSEKKEYGFHNQISFLFITKIWVV